MARAVSSVVGVVVLIALVVAASAGVAALVPAAVADPAPTARLSLDAEADADEISLAHEGGEPVDVRATTVRIGVDGEDLAHQPPVPFFAARGFESGPTGAFNRAGSTTLRAGKSASLRLASTNDPAIEPDSWVRVDVTVDGTTVATLRTRAR